MKTKVQKAYVGSRRTLLNSHGQVYFPGLNTWIPRGDDTVTVVPGVYERWSDVPAAWLGHCPYFR